MKGILAQAQDSYTRSCLQSDKETGSARIRGGWKILGGTSQTYIDVEEESEDDIKVIKIICNLFRISLLEEFSRYLCQLYK